ncbi:hypothetical protein BASA83_003043 [Batrachochytrium salamandrivorans]|nr:hypothetical protein BASA83_003043 [Batrachochytrium salamandrivorans]
MTNLNNNEPAKAVEEDIESTDSIIRVLGYAGRLRNFVTAGSRYLAYTSDVGEAFRPVVPRGLVNAAYGISFAYVGVDVVYEGYKSSLRGDSTTEVSRTVIQRTLFQGLASLLLPAITIHSVVDLTAKALKNASVITLRKWGPTAAGLMVLPALPVILDHPVEYATDKAFDMVWPLSEEAKARAIAHDGRTDLVFAAARAMSGNSSRSAAVTPLYNSNGIVQYDPTSILRVMQGHYGSLAADTTGHSLDLQYWHDRQPIQVSPNTPTIRNSDILDQDFSWNQIAAALLQMSPRKAPGDDGITIAFYQAALYMPANTQEGVPPTPFARALLRVCGQVFASATIPRAWLCASIVSIDKKDGDPLNPGDKRGIALINVGLKLVCKVLQMRIERFVETNNLLSYKQAGFRKREECVGQVVSLVDIIQRRQNAGLNTHVLFIDIRKAFDTVPVGALLWKLQNMGFPRRTLAFLKALYTSSSAQARAGSLLSDPFPVQRGVRQGCSLSGLLFNLFINDILNGVAPITVPGLPRDTNSIRGLMYADDVASLFWL